MGVLRKCNCPSIIRYLSLPNTVGISARGNSHEYYSRQRNLHGYTAYTCYRHHSTDTKPNDTSKEHLKPPGGIKTYIVQRYVNYIKTFEFKVAEHYPRFYKVYKLFKTGIADFFSDTKTYSIVATRIWAGEELDLLTWKELEIYRQMPSDLLRSAPVLIAAPLPAVPYFFYPICYMFPRHLLCRHFWTQDQKLEFGLHYLRHRLPFYPRVLHSLERHSRDIKDVSHRKMFQSLLHKLNTGSHPSVEELLEVKDLFMSKPFGIKDISKLHLWYVARSMDFSTLRHGRFTNDFILLHNIDLAIKREGIESLDHESLQQSCFTRGLNPIGLSEEDMQMFIGQWISLSENVNESSMSLLVHAPIFLTYNSTSNHKYLLPEVDVKAR